MSELFSPVSQVLHVRATRVRTEELVLRMAPTSHVLVLWATLDHSVKVCVQANTQQNIPTCFSQLTIILFAEFWTSCSEKEDLFSSLESEHFSASTENDTTVASNSYLGQPSSWQPTSHVVGQYVQVNLGSIMHIDAVATLGTGSAGVTSYELWYSRWDDTSFVPVRDVITSKARQFEGSVGASQVVVVRMYFPFFAQFVRLYPLQFENEISVKWTLYGCSTGIL